MNAVTTKRWRLMWTDPKRTHWRWANILEGEEVLIKKIVAEFNAHSTQRIWAYRPCYQNEKEL